jgi:probable HAF family extracellular repeat protein
MTRPNQTEFRPAFHTWLLAGGIALAFSGPLPPAFAGSPGTEAVQFTLTDLGTLGGEQSRAYAINKHGQVAGSSDTSAGERHGFLWDNGTMTDLGRLDGNRSTVTALNDEGQVAGYITYPSSFTHAFVWTDGVMTDLGTLPGGFNSQAKAINNRGQVAGGAELLTATDPWPRYASHAVIWQDGKVTDLGTLGGTDSEAWAINDSGQVAGYSFTPSYEMHAFLWADGRMTDLTVGTTGASCGCYAYPTGLNNRGQVVGLEGRFVPPVPPLYVGVVTDAFLWENGTKTIIATGDVHSSYAAYRINDHGEVAGRRVPSIQQPGDVPSAFFWREGVMQEWSLGGDSISTVAITGHGQVVGYGTIPGGGTRGYFWHEGKLSDLGRLVNTVNDVNEQGVVAGSFVFVQFLSAHAALWTPIGPTAPLVAPESGPVPGRSGSR